LDTGEAMRTPPPAAKRSERGAVHQHAAVGREEQPATRAEARALPRDGRLVDHEVDAAVGERREPS
jgi:hypothetical protein